MLFDDIVYGGVPPVIVNVNTEQIPVTVETVGGFIASAGVGGGVTGGVKTDMLALPLLPTLVAVTVHVVADEGAVNVDDAAPRVVWANGGFICPCEGSSPRPQLAEKLTVVPSGAGLPAEVVTAAKIWDVVSTSIVSGAADTETDCIVTGPSRIVIIPAAPLSAEAVIVRGNVTDTRGGFTWITTDAFPFTFVFSELPVRKVTIVGLSEPKVTVLPETGWPELSRTVAVMVVVSPVGLNRLLLVAVRIRLGPAEMGPTRLKDEKNTVFLSLTTPPAAVMSAWMVAKLEVVEVSVTEARPFPSVIAEGALSLPKGEERFVKFTVTFWTGLPLPSSTLPVKVMTPLVCATN